MSKQAHMLWLLCVLLLCVSPAWGESLQSQLVERRLAVGLALFPNLVSIDLNLSQKISEPGVLLLLIVYEHDRGAAEHNLNILRSQVKTIQKIPVMMDLLSVADLGGNHLQPAGIFVAEELTSGSIKKLLRFAESNQCILFSPFEKAVDQGVMIGIKISSKIQPVINAKSLDSSKVRLHKFFLQSAEKR